MDIVRAPRPPARLWQPAVIFAAFLAFVLVLTFGLGNTNAPPAVAAAAPDKDGYVLMGLEAETVEISYYGERRIDYQPDLPLDTRSFAWSGANTFTARGGSGTVNATLSITLPTRFEFNTYGEARPVVSSVAQAVFETKGMVVPEAPVAISIYMPRRDLGTIASAYEGQGANRRVTLRAVAPPKEYVLQDGEGRQGWFQIKWEVTAHLSASGRGDDKVFKKIVTAKYLWEYYARQTPRVTVTPTPTATETPTATPTRAVRIELRPVDRWSVRADGVDTLQFKAYVKDAMTGDPLSGIGVHFLRLPPVGSISPEHGTTDAAGVAQTTYTAPNARDLDEGVRTVLMRAQTVGGEVDQVQILFKFHTLRLEVTPYELMADGASQAAVRVIALDYDGAPAAGEVINLSPPAFGTLSTVSVTTGPDGTASLTYTAPDNAKLGGKIAVNDLIRATNTSHYAVASAQVHLRTVAPVIKEVNPRYAGTMLGTVRAMNAYQVKVEWPKNEPGSVVFDMNGSTSTVEASGPEVVKTYDMGTLNASHSGGNNTLKITALSKDRRLESEPVVIKPLVVPIPDLIDPGVFANNLVGGGDFYRYPARYQTNWKWPDPAWHKEYTFPDVLPWVGSKTFGLTPTQLSVEGEYNSWTTALIAQGVLGTDVLIASKPIKGEFTLRFTDNHVLNEGWNLKELEIRAAAAGKALDSKDDNIPCASLHPTIAAFAQKLEETKFIGPFIEDALRICKLGVDLTGKVAARVLFAATEKFPWLAWKAGYVSPEGTLRGVLRIDLEKWFWMTFGAGGTVRVDIQPLSGWSLDLLGGKVTAFIDYAVGFLSFTQRGTAPISWPRSAAAGAVPLEATQSAWQVTPRDYVGPNYARFVATSGQALQGDLAEVTTASAVRSDTRLIENIYPLTAPALVRLPNGDLLLAWTHDDEAKPLMQGQELYYSVRRFGAWSQPRPITNDTHQDWHPALAVDAAGRVVAVWMRARAANLSVDSHLEDLVPTLEIAYAVYTPATDAWSAPTFLTDNTSVDHTPQLAAAADGRLMVAWVNNAANKLIGSAANPDTVRCATWNGAAWSADGAAASVAGMTGWGLANRGDAARLVLARDMDGDLTADADSELFATSWDGAAWSALARLTDDAVADRAPQPLYRPDGAAWLFWNRGDAEVMWNGDWSVALQAVLNEQAGSLQSVTVVQAADGSLALVWTGVVNAISNLRYALYDAAQAGWSAPIDLATADPTALSGRAAISFAPGGWLQVAYISTAVEEDQRPLSPSAAGGESETVPVPQLGQADLRLLEQQTSLDLVLGQGDLRAIPADAGPGQAITLTATVRNAGDLAARGVTVTFYDGDPAAGGTVIGAPAPVDRLAGGANADFSAAWTLPSDGRAHRVYAVVATDGAVPEAGLANNTATFDLLLPAPRITDGWASYDTGETVALHVQVTNDGSSPLPAAALVFRRGDDGTTVGQAPLAALGPGATLPADLTWDVLDLPAGVYSVTVTLDPLGTVISEGAAISRALAVSLLPDLAVGPGDIRFTVRSNASATAILRVHNVGLRPAENVSLILYTGDPAAGGAPWIRGTLPWIAAGETADLSAEWALPPGAGPVYLVVDPQGTMAETDRSNNVALKARDRLPCIFRAYLPVILKNASSRPVTPGPTPTATITRTVTSTRTRTPSRTPTRTATAISSATPTASRTATATPSPTRTPTSDLPVSPTPTASATPTPSRTPTVTATQPPTPTATLTRTATPTGSVTPAACAWRDDFDSATLDENWFFMAEDMSHWSLTARPGYLRITTQAGDLWADTNTTQNLFAGFPSGADFEISAHVQIAPAQPRQQAVLLVFSDPDNYVQVGRIYYSVGGNQVQMVVEMDGTPIVISTPCSLTDLYLKLGKEGAIFTAYYSSDGVNWTKIGQSLQPHLEEYGVFGLGAWNGNPSNAAEIPADFDWFCLSE